MQKKQRLQTVGQSTSIVAMMTVAFLGLAPACANGDGDGDAGDGDGDGDGDGGGDGDIPTNSADLLPWLEDGNYSDWEKESAIHTEQGTSPHGRVRVFINDILGDSLADENAAHPVGAAAVKELYNSNDDLVGYAVEVKITEGTTGDDWYWYLKSGNNVNADGTGAANCTSCHAGGVDYFTTAYPLQ